MDGKKGSPSRRGIFIAAAIGGFAPQILRWYSQGGIHLPGQTLAQILGWSVAAILFILLAGYIAAYVWGETDLRKAFFIGIGVPSIILSGGTDLIKSFTPGKAYPQSREALPGTVLMTEVKGQGGNILPQATVTIRKSSGTYEAQSSSNPGRFDLQPGTYSIVAESPGYQSHIQPDFQIRAGTNRFSTVLVKASFLEEFLRGMLKPFQQAR